MIKEAILILFEVYSFTAWLIGSVILMYGILHGLKLLLIEYLKEDLKRNKNK